MFRLCRFGNVRGGFVRAGSPGVGFVFLFSYPFKEEQEEHRSRNKELVRSGRGTLVPLMTGLSVATAANPEASSPVGDSVMLALDTLLSAAIDDDACVIDPAWGTAAAGPFRVSGEIAEFTALVEQPIGAAFRLALQRLGEHLVLLRHERGDELVGCRSAWQQGHRSRLLARATVSLRRMVAMELGTCRSGRVGGAVGSSTTGNGSFRAVQGGARA